MRKKIAAVIALACMLLVPGGVTQSRAVSGNTVLNRKTAVELIKNNSTALWDAKEQEQFAKEEYEEQAARSKNIDTVKIFLFVNPFTGEDVYYYYDSAEQMQLRLMKEFVPESLKFNYEVKQKTIRITENTLANTADNLFTGLYSTYHSMKLAQKSLELAEKNFIRQKELFNSGMITGLDLEEAALNVKEAENAVKKAERDYENMHRQFNALAKLPLDFRYDLIGTPVPGEYESGIPVTEEEAVESALKNRMEIWSTKRQIELTEFKMEIYRHKNVYRFHQQTIKDYAKAQDELDKLNIILSQYEYDIEQEIREAYRELENSYNSLESVKLNLEKQKNSLETVKRQYESGLVPASAVEQLELAVEQLELAANISRINVLNGLDRLYRAISVGPGY